MPRKIQPIQSIPGQASPTLAPIPAGARIHSVVGECDTKPTYDFIVEQDEQWGATLFTLQWKYAGVRNGQRVMLEKDWPKMTNVGTVAAASTQQSIAVVAGTGVSLQVYYTLGSVVV